LATPTRPYGIPGGQPIAGLSAIGGAAGSPASVSAATPRTPAEGLPDQRQAHLDQGASLPQDRRPVPALRAAPVLRGQQRALGSFAYAGTSPASPSPTSFSNQVSSKGRAAGTPTTPGPTSPTASPSSSRTTSDPAGPDLEPGPALGLLRRLHREGQRQSNFRRGASPRNGTGVQTFAKDGSTEDRVALQALLRGWEPRVGFRLAPTDRWVVRAATASPVHGGHGLEPSPAHEPAVPSSSRTSTYDQSSGAGHDHHGLRRAGARADAVGQVRAFDRSSGRSSPSSGTSFVERMLTSSSRIEVGYVGHHANKLVAPVEGNQPLPRPWRPLDLGAPNSRRPLSRSSRLITTSVTTPRRGAT